MQTPPMKCARCRGAMRPARLRVGGGRLMMLGVMLMGLGMLLLFASPGRPVLAVPGVLLLALAWWVASRREDAWFCERCQYATRRRDQWVEPQRRNVAQFRHTPAVEKS